MSLRLNVDAVVSGRVPKGEGLVVPLFFGASCESKSIAYGDLVKRFPVGSQVAVSATSLVTPDGPVVVEQNKGGFVVPIPSSIVRTADGDLDFGRFDSSRFWQFGEFEFDRAVLALRAAPAGRRFRRMLNLARYRGFQQWPDGSKWLDTLISESRLSARQRTEVLDAVQNSVGTAR